jgi:hypothetical protein
MCNVRCVMDMCICMVCVRWVRWVYVGEVNVCECVWMYVNVCECVWM